MFANETDPELWSARVRRGQAVVETWRCVEAVSGGDPELTTEVLAFLLPLFTVDGKGGLGLIDERIRFGAGADVMWLIAVERAARAETWLSGHGWEKIVETVVSATPTPAGESG